MSPAPRPEPPPAVLSGDFVAFIARWYASTSPGGAYYQRKQEPGR